MAQDTGFLPFTLAVQDASNGGSLNWANSAGGGAIDASIVSADDGTSAIHATPTDSGANYISPYIKATNPPALPAGARVAGFQARLFKKATGIGGTTDYELKLVVNDVVVGNNKAVGGAWPGSFTLFDYGGASDLWGLDQLFKEAINSTFGLVFSGNHNVSTLWVDSIKMKLFYSMPMFMAM